KTWTPGAIGMMPSVCRLAAVPSAPICHSTKVPSAARLVNGWSVRRIVISNSLKELAFRVSTSLPRIHKASKLTLADRNYRRCGADFPCGVEKFTGRWDDALDDALNPIEKECRRRAVEGTDEPVYYKCKVCGVIKRAGV